MIKFAVGNLYPGIYREGITAEFFRNDANTLIIALDAITPQERDAYKKGKVRAGFLFEQGVILLFFKFGELPWMDCPFNASIISRDQLSIPVLETDSTRLVIEIHVIDHTSRLLKVIRAVSLSPVLSRGLVSAANRQIEKPTPDFATELAHLYQQNTDTLLKRALINPCG